MKTLYFDCSSGISGNMVLGALIEIIDDEKYLLKELEKLNMKGYKIEISKKVKNGITGTYVDVILENEKDYHTHKNLNDIYTLIDNSSIEEKTKKLAKKIFMKIAEAESKVHNKPIEQVNFHEVGAVDSIIDIVGTAILINKINPDKIISSVVNDGYGFIQCMHGSIFVPVPATSEIFASSNVKFKQIDIETELITPTGAAIISQLATEFISLPVMVAYKIGWGAGSKDLKIPNLLKVYYGEIEEIKERIVVMETNIDDCNSEILGFASEKILQNGALDVYFTPIFMKKNRPAYCLTVICSEADISKLQNIIFKETSTIGIRYRFENRTKLYRENIQIDTKYGKVEAKRVRYNNESYICPEYESIKKIAIEKDIPLKELYKLEELINKADN